jgi:hypothetical protein
VAVAGAALYNGMNDYIFMMYECMLLLWLRYRQRHPQLRQHRQLRQLAAVVGVVAAAAATASCGIGGFGGFAASGFNESQLRWLRSLFGLRLPPVCFCHVKPLV